MQLHCRKMACNRNNTIRQV